jgi:ATP-dependent RNA helicase DDX49/DBP8
VPCWRQLSASDSPTRCVSGSGFLPAGQAFKRAGNTQSIASIPKKFRVDEPTNTPGKSCEHIMPAQKALARSMPIKHLPEEASDSKVHSDSDSEPLSQSDNESSDSDSLDSHASRKRRKISLVEVDAPLVPTTSVPSRIKSKVQENESSKHTSDGAILAPLDSTTTFSALNVKPWLVASLGAMAIKRPTGIQKGCIPEILKGRDCIGGSRTGSGKTVAFAVPILQKWAEDPFGIFALVLTPTRYTALLGPYRQLS